MKWKIELYRKKNGEIPVEEFLNSLPNKHRGKAYWEIELLSEYGTAIKEPYAKALTGEDYKAIWELRIKFASDISRIFYFMPVGDTFVLLNGFLKRTEHTPKRELEKAKEYMEDYGRRSIENE